MLVPPHGPCSVVAVRERDPRRRDVGAAWHEESVWLGEKQLHDMERISSSSQSSKKLQHDQFYFSSIKSILKGYDPENECGPRGIVVRPG